MRTRGLVVGVVGSVIALGCGTRTGLLSRGEDGTTAVEDEVGGTDGGASPDGSIPVCGSEPNACGFDAGFGDAYGRLKGVLASCKAGVRCSDWVTVVFDDAGCLSDASFSGLTADEERCVIARTAGARHPCLPREAMVAQGPCP